MKNQQKLFSLFLVMDNAFEVSILKVYIRRVTFTSYSTPPHPPPPQEKITSQICPPPSHNFFSLRFFWYYSGWFLYWDYVMFLFFPKIIWTPFLEKLTPYNATLPPPESKSWMFSKVFFVYWVPFPFSAIVSWSHENYLEDAMREVVMVWAVIWCDQTQQLICRYLAIPGELHHHLRFYIIS